MSNKKEKIEQEINTIVDNAFAGGENKISKKITFIQAASIRFRSIQVKREIHSLSKREFSEKIKQTLGCWVKKENRNT